jgi:hypothetical protein
MTQSLSWFQNMAGFDVRPRQLPGDCLGVSGFRHSRAGGNDKQTPVLSPDIAQISVPSRHLDPLSPKCYRRFPETQGVERLCIKS